MSQFPGIEPTPWDESVFLLKTYEISKPSRDSMEAATRMPGHYTVKVDPLASKELLQQYGFYYCDTLIEPYCTREMFKSFVSCDAVAAQDASLESLLEICDGAFAHGRFHRDFNLSKAQADARYNNWLSQLHAAGKVFDLVYQREVIGFIAVNGASLVLHALASDRRGNGLAKYLWTPVCIKIFDSGVKEITSSVSASNVAVMNLYSRLGFRFRNPLDVYHLLTRPRDV